MVAKFASAGWRGLLAPTKTLIVVLSVAGLLSGCPLQEGDSGTSSSGVFNDAAEPMIGISWRPSDTQVDGYSVYYGSTEDTVDYHFADYTVNSGEIDPTDPQVLISAYYDLGLRSGEQVCFSIQAYNSYGSSGLSTPVCTVLG